MKRKLLFLLALMLFVTSGIFSQSEIAGKIIDSETREPVMFANVAAYKGSSMVTGTQTDIDGNYSIQLDPGTYDIEASYVGLNTQKITGVIVNGGKTSVLDIEMSSGVTLEEIIVVWKVPLVEQDKTTQGRTITSEQIANLPTKDIGALASMTAGVSSTDEGDNISIRGARSDGTDVYVDGIKVSMNAISQSDIDQLQVITGGMEAKYGDATGGIISITTKGPSDSFSGGIEAESSQYLDPYGYNLFSANISGPILKKGKESILGFRFSGQYVSKKDDDPPAIDVYRIKDEKLAELQENPIIEINGTKLPAAEFLTDDDVNAMAYKPFEEDTRYDATGKLDAKLGKAIDVTLTGGYSFEKDFITPSFTSPSSSRGVRRPVYHNQRGRVLNSHNNPFDNSTRYRVNFRFRHRLGGGSNAGSDEGGKNSVIRNAMYVLQGGYNKFVYGIEDKVHKDNFFNYGYIGSFDFDWVPTIGAIDNPDFPFAHNGYLREFKGYDNASTTNSVLANYNNVVNDPNEYNEYVAKNGDISRIYSSVWGYSDNVGSVFNFYRKINNETQTFNAYTAFQIVPGSSDKGVHTIQLGLTYEQKVNRLYEIKPFELWQLSRDLANGHFNGLDTTIQVGDTLYQSVLLPVYAPKITEPEDLLFYKRVRALNNTSLNEYINVDGLSPDDLSLDMFSAKELNDDYSNIGLDYYGYDYLGNLLDGVTFNDFFTAKNSEGIRTFPVAAWQPNYMAAYIQDKFKYKDIYFRLGVRVDRYDANTKVMKDPFSLYEVMSAKDFHDQFGGERPGNIDDDFKVYVTSEEGEIVQAYRDDEQWYRSNGTPVNDGKEIFGGELVFPRYTSEEPNIQSRDFDPSISFKDYEPQINYAPRIAVSFPISEDANFFAHYDILVQRPPVRSFASPLDYYYFNTRNGSKNNPNMRPERTIDYEVGFQQKLTESSAIKLSTYYREMRDMVQFRTYYFFPAPLNQYDTYDNRDFGTVKGFSFQYDLRRTGNVSLLVSYNLQFADGTGSNESSSSQLARGIRTLYPLSFDERHRINVGIDYRYLSGKKYTGPKLFGKDIFSSTGANIQVVAVSGRPYTAKQTPIEFWGEGTVGAINGSRLPWHFTVNLRIDKDFNLTKPDAKMPVGLNVYLRVSNLLDSRNIITVYPATGSPSDDGFLATSKGRGFLEGLSAGRSQEGYLAAYRWRMLDSDFFSLPRRIYLGAMVNF